ncbi:response regulator [Paenibacillus sp. IB182496]|uniref:histidine kinase n=1 Tax=Paenibacillus sabuli TaxID=2772509 RepID=A0A927GUG4_9BACL|nr:ATP-binding protein [Paenibacillus sabuli]MBD2848130.1 response regulator [Paenibacillus sabuli]
MIKRHILGIFLLVILFMTTGRVLWMELFKPSGQPYAVNGILDLRHGSFKEGAPLTLDGEWLFYQSKLLPSEREVAEGASLIGERIDVPGSWNSILSEGEEQPYGFGTYRLVVLVPQGSELYSVYVPSVRSASRLYANGQLVGSSGLPAADAASHEAENVPYVATFAADEQGRIELLVQAANYTDPRSGGLVRSFKFGTVAAVAREKQLSMATQQLIAAAIVIQAIYLMVFWAIERRKLWAALALTLICFTVIMLNSSEDKLLLQWFPITLEWSYRLLCLALVLLFYGLLHTVSDAVPGVWRSRVLRFYGVAAAAGVLVSLGIPIQRNQLVQYVIFTAAVPIIILLLRTLPRLGARGVRNRSGLLQLLAFAAFANHMLWWSVHMFLGIKLIFYPFDLILGMLLLSSIWVRRYYALYTEQKGLTDRLERINRQKDVFLANTSHELRNPLHGMINMTQAVAERERAILSEGSRSELDTVLRVGRRMSHMLSDLLDAARLKDSTIQLNKRALALQPVVNGVLDMLRFMLEGKPVSLTNRVPARLPHVIADEQRLIQILFNLVHNALKFTSRGEVNVTARLEEDRILVVVSDTGIGMDAAMLKRVFEPYEQADPERAEEGGFGLGLNIARQLVELHGGALRARSSLGEGAAFTFALQADTSSELRVWLQEQAGAASDLVSAMSPPAPLLPPDQPASNHGNGTDQPRILAVDDDALNLRILRSILAGDAYITATAADGAQALALIEAQSWDLVIADVMMPGMSGYALTRCIREQYTVSELPVLLLTARSQPEDIEQGFLAGANDYVTKPVEPRELRARVQALTHLKRSARERLRMEAAWLQAQIEPHFLLNTLNSIAALQAIDPARMNELIVHFGAYLREKFKFQNVGTLVPLQDELALVRAYLYIEQTRFGERLEVEWGIDEGIEQLQVPPYSIQPLVENAIRHGLMKRRQGGKVRIELKQAEGLVAIAIVSDDGAGMRAEAVQRLLQPRTEGGIGLRNVDLRLKRLYGAGLVIDSAPGQGTRVSFRFGIVASQEEKKLTYS